MQARRWLAPLALAAALVFPAHTCRHDDDWTGPSNGNGTVYVVATNATDGSIWLNRSSGFGGDSEVRPGGDLEILRLYDTRNGSFRILGSNGHVRAYVDYSLHRVPRDSWDSTTVRVRITADASRALQVTSDRPDVFEITRVENVP